MGHWEGREGQDVGRGVRQQLGHLGKGLPELFHYSVQLAVDLGGRQLLVDGAHHVVAVSPRSPIGYNSGRRRSSGHLVAVSPRSPIGYNSNRIAPDDQIVAVSPRSPIGYNLGTVVHPALQQLRLAPDLPSATMRASVSSSSHPVAVSPRSPIGYNGVPAMTLLWSVAVSPRSPIGYNPDEESKDGARVAVSPRSPIGYNEGTHWALQTSGCG